MPLLFIAGNQKLLSQILPPYIAQEGVRNAASQLPPSLPGGSLAPGVRFTIEGLRFGARADRVSVTFHTAGAAFPAKVIAVRDERIEADAPVNLPLGSFELVVVRDGFASQRFPLKVAIASPGIFSQAGNGWGSALSREVSFEHPARPGEIVELAVTGLTGLRQVEVYAGGERVTLRPESVAGRLMVPLPRQMSTGCYVPFRIEAPGGAVSNTATLAVTKDGKPCEQPANWPVARRAAGSRGAYALLLTERVHLRLQNSPFFTYQKDEAMAMFYEQGSAPLSFVNLLPPPGTCSTFSALFHPSGTLPSSFADILRPDWVVRSLDAGPDLRAAGRMVERDSTVRGLYRSVFSVNMGGRGDKAFLTPGDYQLSGAGGAEAGAFTAPLTLPDEPKLSNAGALRSIERGKPLMVRWQAADKHQQILILITNTDQETTAMSTCLCVAKQGAAAFEIPRNALANIPASRRLPGIPVGFVFIVQIPAGPLTSIDVQGIQGLKAMPARLVGEGADFR